MILVFSKTVTLSEASMILTICDVFFYKLFKLEDWFKKKCH